jgi:hypothetical protein
MPVAQYPTPDEATEILRRLEPTLVRLDAGVRKIEIDLVRLDGRVGGLSSKTPTLLQIIGAVLGINAGILAIAFGLVNVQRG